MSRKRLDVCVADRDGAAVLETAVAPNAAGITRAGARGCRSMTGPRLVHDRLEELAWEAEIADA